MKTRVSARRRTAGLTAGAVLLILAVSNAQGPGLHLAWGTSDGLGAMSGGPFVLKDGGEFTMVTTRESVGIGNENGLNAVIWSRLAAGWHLEIASEPSAGWSPVSPTLWQTNETRILYPLPTGTPAGFFRLARP